MKLISVKLVICYLGACTWTLTDRMAVPAGQSLSMLQTVAIALTSVVFNGGLG